MSRHYTEAEQQKIRKAFALLDGHDICLCNSHLWDNVDTSCRACCDAGCMGISSNSRCKVTGELIPWTTQEEREEFIRRGCPGYP